MSSSSTKTVPIAVHPHDPDSVFLSKTIVSLQDVFSHSVDGRFDLSRLPDKASTRVITDRQREEVPEELPCPSAALPFSSGSQPYFTSTPRDAPLDGPTPSTRASQQEQQQQRQYATVVQSVRAQCPAAAPAALGGAAQSESAQQAGKLSLSWPSSSACRGRAAPQLLVVPLDAYHFLLSFRDVDVAELPTTTDAATMAGSKTHNSEGSAGTEDGFAAATRAAVASVEQVSAEAPGPRPPRSGVCVVRRVEGEMRDASTPPLSTATTEGAGVQVDGAAAAASSVVYPTLSRVARHLPFASFDGWVRDYTVYGLSPNAHALRSAWAEKLHERDARVAESDDDDDQADPGTDLTSKRVLKGAAGRVGRVHPAGPVIEVVEPVTEAAVKGDTVYDTATTSNADALAATAPSATHESPPQLKSSEVDAPANTNDDADVPSMEPLKPEGVARNAATNVQVGTEYEGKEVSESNQVDISVHIVDNEGKEVSPSLERLNCSSTTASTTTSSASSLSLDLQTHAAAQVNSTSPGSFKKQQQQQPFEVLEETTIPLTAAAASSSLHLPQEPAAQQPQRLWSEERRREAAVAAQLTHRFLVADAVQHAIWAIEVNVPAMDVRVVAPAEFYSLDEASDPHNDDDGSDDDVESRKEEGHVGVKLNELPREKNGHAFPRRKSATEVTQARTRTPSPTPRGGDATVASTARSPSPSNPQVALADEEGNKTTKEGQEQIPASLPEAEGGDAKVATSTLEEATGLTAAAATTINGVDASITPNDRNADSSSPRRLADGSASRSRRTRRGRSSKSASPSVALAEALLTPLMGGARGFVDGHFSVARFNCPGALCWRVEEDEEEGGTTAAMPDEADRHGNANCVDGKPEVEEYARCDDDPLRHLQRHRRCSVLFISDVGNCAIRYANFHNRLVRTIAGVDGVPGYRDGSCVSSLLRGATALAWCSAGLLFTDGPNSVVRLITHVGRAAPSAATQTRGRGEGEGEKDAGEPVKEGDVKQNSELATEDAEGSGSAQQADTPAAADAAMAMKKSATTADVAAQQSTTADAEKEDMLDALFGPDPASAPPASASPTLHKLTDTEASSVQAATQSVKAGAPSSSHQQVSAANKPRTARCESHVKEAATPVVPRVWTLAGCVRGVDSRTPTSTDAITTPTTTISNEAVASYVDSSAAARACFGYLSDMALWTDETGNAQLYVLDQTHHAVRVLDGEGGVSTYVGPLDYATTSTSLPAGLTHPSSFAMTALIKERSPALMDHDRANMLTPQPYLYSSTPALFVASAVNGAVSVLLPVSQRSALVPWNATAQLSHASGQTGDTERNSGANVYDQIRKALTLGIASEGRRTIGEATAPSLKHVVAGWTVDDGDDGEDEMDDGREVNGHLSAAAPAAASVRHAKDRAETKRLLRRARVQQALLYLRLRFPWVLPPAVPQLSQQLLASCTCHVSGRRRGTSAQRRPSTCFAPPDLHREAHDNPSPRTAATGGGVGAPRMTLSLLPRTRRSLSGGRADARLSPRGNVAGQPPMSPRSPSLASAGSSSPQRLLFSTPPRHPVVPYTQSIRDPRTAAAAKEVAELLFFPSAGAVPAGPRIIEVQESENLKVAVPGVAGGVEKDSGASLRTFDGDKKGGSTPPAAGESEVPVHSTSNNNAQSEKKVETKSEEQKREEHAEDEGGHDGASHEMAEGAGGAAANTADIADVSNSDEEVEDAPQDGRSPLKLRGAATHKWLPPPTKSLSRSPVSTPRRGSADETPTAAATTTKATPAADGQSAAETTPAKPSALSYAEKFQKLPPEQRQLRLLHTLDQHADDADGLEPAAEAAAASATPRDASASPSPRKVEDHNEDVATSDKKKEEEKVPKQQQQPQQHPHAGGGALRERSQSATSPLHSPTSSRRRHSLTPSRSPNNSSGRGSPPLTPRSMAAHQLMQRRGRSSRSTTAPHVASVGSTAAGASSQRASQDPHNKPASAEEAWVESGKSLAEKADQREQLASTKQQQRQQQQQEILFERSPSHTVHEAGEASPAGILTTLVRPVKLPTFHDTYDAAVRRLFQVYAYFATKTVTHTAAVVTTAAARSSGDVVNSAAGGGVRSAAAAARGTTAARLSPRVVEHYSMSFTAFHRFLTLTGYLDFLASVATMPAASTRAGAENPTVLSSSASQPSLARWAVHLTQAQRRRTVAGSAATAATTTANPAAAKQSTSSFPSTSYTHTAAAAVDSVDAPSSTPSTQPLLLLPLAVSDTRAVADVLYHCGVRTQGYHVVTCMDFQAFRRAVLLLRTWAVTAWEKQQQQQQQQQRRGGAASGSDEDGAGVFEDASTSEAAAAAAAAFAYLDDVPALDALPAEEVVAAYAEVYEQAVRAVPALEPLRPTKAARKHPGKADATQAHDTRDSRLESSSSSMSPTAARCARQDTQHTRNEHHGSSSRGTEDDDARAKGKGRGFQPLQLPSEVEESTGEQSGCFEDSAALDVRGATAITPPVSPIAHAINGDDVSCVLDANDRSASADKQKAYVENDDDLLHNGKKKTRRSNTGSGGERSRSSTSSRDGCGSDHTEHSPPYLTSALSAEARLALDDVLRLLQRNETTLRQLFDAYSVPVVVHRSRGYTAPHSAAAAAAVSNPCSLLLNDSRSFGSREALVANSSGSRAQPAARLKSKVAEPKLVTEGRGTTQKLLPSTTAAGGGGAARAATPAEAAYACVTAAVPVTRQDMAWKVQQLFTMSSLESKEVFARTSHTIHVVPYRLFVELWRTLDVFPSLMTTTATQQAYLDAVTTPLLRGNGGGDVDASHPDDAAFNSALQPRSNTAVGDAAAAISSALAASSKKTAVAAVKASTRAKLAAAQEREVEELLFAHTGLPFPCFVESFVRVALTVFSHEVDRVAYPTSAAKTMGLMQWCNKQVRLGLVEQRTQKQLHNVAAAVESVARSSRGSSTNMQDSRSVGSRRRSSGLAVAAATASALLATRATRSSGMFPDHLQLFHVPPTQKRT